MEEIDMSLDDIISRKRSVHGRRGGRLGFRGAGVDGRGRARRVRYYDSGFDEQSFGSPLNTLRSGGKWQHDLYEDDKNDGMNFGRISSRISRQGFSKISNQTNKLLVSNLEFGVSDNDLKELFDDFGPVRKLVVHYDRSGRSCGTAEIIFDYREHAMNAMKHYNGVLLDGRPMVIQPSPYNPNSGMESSNAIVELRSRGGFRGRLASATYGSTRNNLRRGVLSSNGGFARFQRLASERTSWRLGPMYDDASISQTSSDFSTSNYAMSFKPSNFIKSRPYRRTLRTIDSNDLIGTSNDGTKPLGVVSSAELDSQLDNYINRAHLSNNKVSQEHTFDDVQPPQKSQRDLPSPIKFDVSPDKTVDDNDKPMECADVNSDDSKCTAIINSVTVEAVAGSSL